jgi:glyoxylase-like metal-dependent hydrolase (beta-lactamase superfamily II)
MRSKLCIPVVEGEGGGDVVIVDDGFNIAATMIVRIIQAINKPSEITIMTIVNTFDWRAEALSCEK